jgi:hypothetical protein
MKDSLKHRVQWLQAQRGSALILTMLILLVLSGLGMVALRSTTRSVQQSGTYRVRTQANTFSEAAVEYSGSLASQDAATFWGMMRSSQDNALNGLSDISNRQDRHAIGPFIKLHQKGAEDTADRVNHFEGMTPTATATGLFGDDSFEDGEQGAEFEVIFRDPLDGPPAPGYGENYCFKKVTITSRAIVGEPDRTWAGSGMMGERRNSIEAFIGPIECGAR